MSSLLVLRCRGNNVSSLMKHSINRARAASRVVTRNTTSSGCKSPLHLRLATASISTIPNSIGATVWLEGKCNYHDLPLTASTDNSCTNSTQLLACSALSLDEKDKNWVERVIQWLQNWAQAFWDGILVSARAGQILVNFSPLFVLTPAAVVANSFGNHDVSDAAWWFVTHAVQVTGPAFVKLCQWIATRRDIFPAHICDHLSRLHDDGIPHSWQHTHNILTEAFGSYQEKGLSISPDGMIGCGSAAQVYKATLTSKDRNGNDIQRDVAVKVLHPNFSRLVERDLWLMQKVANFLHSIPFDHLKMLNLPRATSNFASILRLQADLHVESNNLRNFRSNFYGVKDDDSNASVVFPNPAEGWVSDKVLVEDFHDANPISEYLTDDSAHGTEIRRELAAPLLRAFLKMVFVDNFVHCDLHPGNVLVKTTERHLPTSRHLTYAEGEDVQHSIVFLDAGITETLGPTEKRNLKDLFRCIILNDGREAGRLMIERAKYERCSQVEGGVEAFSSGVEAIVSEFHDRRKKGLCLGTVRIGALLSRVLDLCRVHGVEIDPCMANIVISTLVLEGLGRSLDSNLNLLDFAVPFILGRGKI